MAVIDVPVNTMLADLDETLRRLLRRELERHGFDGVNIVFDAPTREWAAGLSAPTVALFLYDLHEADEARRSTWTEYRGNGRAWQERPPLMIDCSYSITAWTRAVEDEHRLLSQVLGITYAYAQIPDGLLMGRLAGTDGATVPVRGRTGQAREASRPEFWTALGGQYKASVDYVVTLPFPAGTVIERGPEARTRAVRTELVDLPSRADIRLTVGGTVHDGSGAPVENAWVVVEEVGAWAATGPDGRFRLQRVPPGRHCLRVRSATGTSAEVELVVPGRGVDVVLAPFA